MELKFFYASLACDSWSLCIHFRTLWLSNLYFLMECLTAGMVTVGSLWEGYLCYGLPQLHVELIVLEHKAAAALEVVCHPSRVLTLGG